MRTLRIITTAAVLAASFTVGLTVDATAVAYDPEVRVRVGAVDTEGRTPVRVIVDNENSAKRVNVEVVRKYAKTTRYAYQAAPAGGRSVSRFTLTPGQDVRVIGRFMDARIANVAVTGTRPTRPTATVARRQCAGVGTLVTFLYRNPTASARRFTTTVWMGDGSGKVVTRVRIPARSRGVSDVQIGGRSADALIEVGKGRDLLGRFISPLPGC